MTAPRGASKSGSKPELKEVPHPAGGRTATFVEPGEARAILLAAGAIALFLYFVRSMLLPFVLAGVLAYICTPLVDWLAKRTRLPRLLFAVLLFLLLLGSAVLFLTLAAQHLMTEARGTTTDLHGMLESLVRQVIGDDAIRLFGQSLNAGEIVRTVLDRAGDWLGQPNGLATVTDYSLEAVMGSFLTVVLLLYFLVSGRSAARGLFWVVPPNRRPLVSQIWSRLDPVLKRYFLGVIVVVLYSTIASYVGLGLVLGIDHAVLLALLTGILETLPVVGPIAAATIAGLVSLRTATGFSSILAYAVYATLLRLSVDEIVGPIVLGRAARVHPVLIMFCTLAGGILFGMPGVILAVPVALTGKSTLATLYGEEHP